jgi:hypothetical protein
VNYDMDERDVIIERERLAELRADLAAANALLERGRHPFENRDAYLAWAEDVDTHLERVRG